MHRNWFGYIDAVGFSGTRRIDLGFYVSKWCFNDGRIAVKEDAWKDRAQIDIHESLIHGYDGIVFNMLA